MDEKFEKKFEHKRNYTPNNGQPKEESIRKEKSLTKIVVIAYRSNEMYDHIVQSIGDEIKKKGRNVKIIAFPRETSEEAISIWIKENTELFKNNKIIVDETIKRNIEETPFLVIDEEARKTVEQICKEELGNIQGGYFAGSYGDGYKTLLKTYFEKNLLYVPKKIYIIPDRCKDHMHGEGINSDFDAAQKIKEWTNELGIEAVVTTNPPKESNTWVLVDRHKKYNPVIDTEQPVLILPVENLYTSISKLIERDNNDKVVKRISENISKQFEKTKEEGSVEKVEINLRPIEKKIQDQSFPREAREYIDAIAPSLGCDCTYDVICPEGRRDIGAIRRLVENGSSYGYDIIYLVWRKKDGKIAAKELINSENTREYLDIKKVSENNESIDVKISSSSGEKIITISKKDIEEWEKTIQDDIDPLRFKNYQKGFAAESKWLISQFPETKEYLRVAVEQINRLIQTVNDENPNGIKTLMTVHKEKIEQISKKYPESISEILNRASIIAEVYDEKLTEETLEILNIIKKEEHVREAIHILSEMAMLHNSATIYKRVLSVLKKNIKNEDRLSKILQDDRLEFQLDTVIEEALNEYEKE
jgi:hypothetical protein